MAVHCSYYKGGPANTLLTIIAWTKIMKLNPIRFQSTMSATQNPV